jgi:hypothetical protein
MQSSTSLSLHLSNPISDAIKNQMIKFANIDTGIFQFRRIIIRDLCFYKACRLTRLRGIRIVSLSAKQDEGVLVGFRFDSSTLLVAPK